MKILQYFFRVCFLGGFIGLIYLYLLLPLILKKNDDHDKVLKIYTWANRIDESCLQEFERKTGIAVYVNYYESVEELLTKLELMPYIDCDIMIPSSYAVSRMAKAGIIKPIDTVRCHFLKNIYPEFFKVHNDAQRCNPVQCFAIPMYWDVFGIGYNVHALKDRKITLDLLFDQKSLVGSAVGMTDEPREAIFLAASYLKLDLHKLQVADLKKIRQLLKLQKPWVGAYSDSQQGYYLSSDTFNVVAAERELICRQMISNPNIAFSLIPTGSMLRVDNVVINAQSKKDDLIYEFLAFLFSSEVMLHNAQEFSILPTMTSVYEQLDFKNIGVKNLKLDTDLFKKVVVFNVDMTQKEINDFWIRFKSS